MKVFIALVLFLCGPSLLALAADLDAHPGYLESVEGERYQISREVVILPPQEDSTPLLKDRIFDEEMTDEITTEYEDRFGRTQAQQIFATPSIYYEKELENGAVITVEEDFDQQRKFGNFVVKRLVEYHFDNYLKTNPKARPVYEIKESLKDISVQAGPQYKFRFKYSLSRNDLDVYVKNPHNIDNRVSFKMDDDETLLQLGYPLNHRYSVATDYETSEEVWNLTGTRKINEKMSTTLTGTQKPEGEGFLVGFSWTDWH